MGDKINFNPWTNKYDWTIVEYFKGVLAASPASPQAGWTYINSINDGYYIYSGSNWILLMVLTAVGAYVLKAGDTMTGDLTLPALHATASGESVFNEDVRFNGDIILQQGQKIIMDGA